METNVDDIGKFGYLKFSAQTMATWLFLFSLNTLETEKDQIIAFATKKQTVCGQQNVHVF